MEKITMSKLDEIMSEYNNRFPDKSHDPNLKAVIVYKQSNFVKEYDLKARSYEVSNNNKRWQNGMISNSLFGSSLDGADLGVHLDWYNWDVDYCYMLDSEPVKLVLTSTDKNVILDLDKEGKVTMKKQTMTDEQLREVANSDTIFTTAELREFLGLSQARFCEKYGIPRRTLEDWERADREDTRKKNPVWVLNLLNRVVKEDIKHDLRYGKKAKK